MGTFRIAKTEYVTVEPGIYKARIAAVEPCDGQYGEQAKFTFDLLDAGEDVSLTGWCSAGKYTEKSKLFEWTRATLGPAFDPDAEWDADLLIGKQVALNVELRQSPKGTTFNKVAAVLPSRQPARRVAVPAAEKKILSDLGFETPPAPEPPDDDALWDEQPGN